MIDSLTIWTTKKYNQKKINYFNWRILQNIQNLTIKNNRHNFLTKFTISYLTKANDQEDNQQFYSN